MLKVGDVIKFRGDGTSVPNGFRTVPEGAPRHEFYTGNSGSTNFKINRGVIKYVYTDAKNIIWYSVEYTDTADEKVRLGFKEEDLIPIENRIKNLRKELIRRQQNGI